MPGFNGTGPYGMGPMTGRGTGYCIVPLPVRGDDLVALKTEVQTVRQKLEQIKSRLSRLENRPGTMSKE